jgi:isopenicillin N synthase-like dioxygenase
VLEESFDISRDFFDRPLEEKMELSPDLKDRKPAVPVFQLGYEHYPVLQGVLNRMEELEFRDFHLREGKEESYTNGDNALHDLDPGLNWWPKSPTGYREKTERLLAELGKVGDTVLDVLSESLGLVPTYLRLEHHKNATVPRYMIFHHYPKSTSSTVDETGILPHRDSSVFTIVSQGYNEAGLKINPYGQWVSVNPQPGSLVVNVGDILEVWIDPLIRVVVRRKSAADLWTCLYVSSRSQLAYQEFFCLQSSEN